MKTIILIVIFVVSAFGMSEATDVFVFYYKVVYNDCAAITVRFIGSLIADMKK